MINSQFIVAPQSKMNNNYLFTSKRLGFRNWEISDLEEMSATNADSEVMEHFSKTLSKEETKVFIERQQAHFEKFGYTYFATELLETGEFIGFSVLDFESEFTPATDIGWRLKKSVWGKGLATEGAKRCIEFAFKELLLTRIVSIFTENNLKSEMVMQKIGMLKKGAFNHPKLKDFPSFEKCFWYEIEKK